MRKAIFICVCIPLFILSLSCSKGNVTSPSTGDDIGVSSLKAGDACGKRMLWGLWEFRGDTRTQKLEATPLRYGMAHLNALVFLEPPANVLLKVSGIKVTGNQIDADVSLTHPFIGKPEYTAFDVKGIVITPANDNSYPGPLVTIADEDATHLANPDGLTLWWGPFLFPPNPQWPNQGYIDGLLGTPDKVAKYASNVNAYKYFCDDLGSNDDISLMNPAHRGMFSAGKKNTRHYTIKVMQNPFTFNYAVDANWAWPKKIPPTNIPGDFPLQANQPEAYRVEVSEVKNTLYYDGYFSGGDLILDITVYCWRDPSTTRCVFIESPSVLTQVFSEVPYATGDSWARYRLTATTCTPRATGALPILIGVQTNLVEVKYGSMSIDRAPLTAYFKYKTDVGAVPPTDGIPGIPRGIHPGEVQKFQPPAGYSWLESQGSDNATVHGNHVVIPARAHSGGPDNPCIFESTDGGKTFSSTPLVLGDPSPGGTGGEYMRTAIDSHDGIHCVIALRKGVGIWDPKILGYFYIPSNGDPVGPILPIGSEPPESYPRFAFIFIDDEDIVHIIYIAVNSPDVMKPHKVFEVTSANYADFTAPQEVFAFPYEYWGSWQDETSFVMAGDGEIFVAFQMDKETGTSSDIYFGHGFAGDFSEFVKVNDEFWTLYQSQPFVLLQGQNSYIFWLNQYGDAYYGAYYVAAQAVFIPYGGTPSKPINLIYSSMVTNIYPCRNSWGIPLFSPFSNWGIASGYTYSKAGYIWKTSILSYPEGIFCNFLPGSNEGHFDSIWRIASESGIVIYDIGDIDNPSEYSFTPFDFY